MGSTPGRTRSRNTEGRRREVLRDGRIANCSGAPNQRKLRSLTGTWEGVVNGFPQGDFPFTMSLEQQDEDVRGVLAVFFGGGGFKPSTLRNSTVELHWDTPLANFVFKGEYTAGSSPANGTRMKAQEARGTLQRASKMQKQMRTGRFALIRRSLLRSGMLAAFTALAPIQSSAPRATVAVAQLVSS